MDTASLKHLLALHPFKELPRKKPDDPTYLLTCPVRIRWCNLATPRAMQRGPLQAVTATTTEQGTGKLLYDATFLVPSEADIDPLRNVFVRLMNERFGPEWNKVLVRGMTDPATGATVMVSSVTGGIKQQSVLHAKGEAGFEKTGVYFSASSTRQPVIVSGVKNPATGTFDALDPKDPAQVYAGMRVIAYLRAYARPKPGAKLDNPGVSFQLESLQKVADDTHFESRSKTANFSEIHAHAGVTSVVSGPAEAPKTLAGF